MSEIALRNVCKQFDSEHYGVKDFNLDIHDKEFVIFVGPSGCGKSTTLRIIAGLEEITDGELWIDGELSNYLEPKERGMSMVFQNYALYPNMTVYGNMAYALKIRKMPKDEIDKKVHEVAKILEIEQLLDRKPAALSGGQKQRVAIGSAIIRKPKAFLMDEPLSNLDAKLRVEMRTVIKNIQHSVGITTIYVTHDQEEAMAVSDRIAVMKGGVIQHIGTPKAIYQRPANLFVSTFIGRSNVLNGKLVMKDGVPHLRLLDYDAPMPHVKEEYRKDADIMISVRPEEFLMSRETGKGIKAVVDDCVFLGLNTHYFMHLENGQEVESIQESTIDSIIEPGTEISLTINTEKANLFTADGEKNILTGVQNDCES